MSPRGDMMMALTFLISYNVMISILQYLINVKKLKMKVQSHSFPY